MAVYSKKQLTEQAELIGVLRALTALTIFRLIQTSKRLEETHDMLEKINTSLNRVFQIYPFNDPQSLKAQKELRDKQAKRSLRVLYVLVSSNKELYGDLVTNIVANFIADMHKAAVDGLVIGKVGKVLVEREHLPNRITYFEIDDDKPEYHKFQEMMDVVAQYDKVVVYHGKSDSLLHQVATKSELDRDIPNLIKPVKKYFFEPTPEEVLEFLKQQVEINSFHQKMFEAQMARLTAKKWNWTKQQLARSKMLEQLVQQYRKYKRGVVQKQQMATLTAKTQEENLVVDVYQTKY